MCELFLVMENNVTLADNLMSNSIFKLKFLCNKNLGRI